MDKKILVIEDDPIATRLVDYVLRQRGYQVLTAPNGLAGLQLAQKEQPDLIVLNVMLPGIDGFEVCHRLRSGPKNAQPLILMLSGRAQPEDIDNGLATGADDYLTKPASPSEIVSRVESLLNKQADNDNRTIAFLSSVAGAGATTAAVNTAIALTQAGKRVLLADCCPYEGSASACLGIKPRAGAPGETSATLTSPVVHDTGLSVLRFTVRTAEGPGPYLAKYRKTADYCLLDLPLEPGAAAGEMLARCSLALVVSDFGLDALAEARAALRVLRFLAVPPENTGVIITDSRGKCPAGNLEDFRPYVEASLEASVLGTLPREAGFECAPQILASPEGPLARAARELAQQIMAAGITEPNTSGTGVR